MQCFWLKNSYYLFKYYSGNFEGKCRRCFYIGLTKHNKSCMGVNYFLWIFCKNKLFSHYFIWLKNYIRYTFSRLVFGYLIRFFFNLIINWSSIINVNMHFMHWSHLLVEHEYKWVQSCSADQLCFISLITKSIRPKPWHVYSSNYSWTANVLHSDFGMVFPNDSIYLLFPQPHVILCTILEM